MKKQCSQYFIHFEKKIQFEHCLTCSHCIFNSCIMTNGKAGSINSSVFFYSRLYQNYKKKINKNFYSDFKGSLSWSVQGHQAFTIFNLQVEISTFYSG